MKTYAEIMRDHLKGMFPITVVEQNSLNKHLQSSQRALLQEGNILDSSRTERQV